MDYVSAETVYRPEIGDLQYSPPPPSQQTEPLPQGAAVGSAGNSVAVQFVLRLVCFSHAVCEKEVAGPDRGSLQVTRTRQTIMYLLHTKLSLQFQEIANVFGRDRKTVSHGCRVVEWSRDDPMHDCALSELEEMIDLAISMRPPPSSPEKSPEPSTEPSPTPEALPLAPPQLTLVHSQARP